MKAQNDIESYVSDLRGRLHLRADVLERIFSESEAHLQDRAAAHVATGMDRREAESLAVAEFGPAWRVALRFRLAYLDVPTVLAWTVAMLAIVYFAQQVAHSLSNPAIRQNVRENWPAGVAIGIAEIVVILSIGFVVTAIFPRRRALGAGLASVVSVAAQVAPQIVSTGRSFGANWQGHIWNGLQSGFSARFPDALVNQPNQLVLFRDSQMLEQLVMTFACVLLGACAASAIRVKLARRGSRVAA